MSNDACLRALVSALHQLQLAHDATEDRCLKARIKEATKDVSRLLPAACPDRRAGDVAMDEVVS